MNVLHDKKRKSKANDNNINVLDVVMTRPGPPHHSLTLLLYIIQCSIVDTDIQTT